MTQKKEKVSNSNNNAELGKSIGELTDTETALLMGTVLGDSNIKKKASNWRIRILHKEENKDYVLWKRAKLARLCSTTKEPYKILQKRQGNEYPAYEFYTSTLPNFGPLRNLFYKPVVVLGPEGNPLMGPDGQVETKFKKLITQELIDKLPMNQLVLAAFYMDDGSVRNDCYAGKIASQGFQKEENLLFSSYLAKRGVDCTVVRHTTKGGQYYINLSANTFSRFIEIIEPTVREVPSMVYKLNELRKN
jgi:hypothetical protein